MRSSLFTTATAALTLGAALVAANNNNKDASTSDIRAAIPSSQVSIRNVSSLADLSSNGSNGETWIFLGALDSDPLLNAVVNATSLDVSATRGQWEAWTVNTATWQGSQVAVIAGADRRGAAYAAYTLWADVPTQQHSSVSLHACSHGSPVVKYRAIFLNDEQPGLTNWANKQFHKGNNPSSTDPLGQSFTVDMYEKLFDLLLRLKANMLWPAMWADMFAVAGLPEMPGNGTDGRNAAGPNQVLAGEMGIIYGTSHQEPMARNTPEWNHYSGPWNYTSNKEVLETYWKYGADRAAPYETLFTVGMRGNGDIPLSGANIQILQNIVADQRSILEAAHPGRNIEDIPQLWCMYKEVQGYFDDDGLQVPDDVTLLWTDDNWSNIRRVPSGAERNRTGGAGLYWHHDYVGQPRNYKWISTINFAKTWEQFNVAQTTGMDRILVINVGDFKPIEVATEFALHLAYEGTQSLLVGQDSGDVPDPMRWTTEWAARTFPNLEAATVATIVQGYNAINAKVKPELVNSTTWSLTMHREAERVEAEWDALVQLVYQLQAHVSDEQYPAFYQLVAFPALASANLNKLYIAAGRSNLHGSQARTSASYWAEQARQHFAHDAELTNEYHSLLDYKWDGMMAQPHINMYYWQQAMRNTLPQVTEVQMDAWPIDGDGGSPGALLSPMRVTVQGSKGANPGDNVNNCPDGYNCPPLALPSLSRYSAQPSRWIDVSSGSWVDFAYNATANVSWITLTPSNGWVAANGSADCRVEVSVNWDAVPANATSMLYASITLSPTPTAFSNSNTSVTIAVDPTTVQNLQLHVGGFVQGEPAYIAMHATNSTRRNDSQEAYWSELPGYGLTGNAVTTLPPTHPNATAGTGPVLEFDFFALPSLAGKSNLWNVTIWLGPFYNYRLHDPFQFALQLDDGEPTVVQPVPFASSAGSEPPDWNSVVAASIRRNTTSLPAVADNDWHTLKVWSLNAGMVLEMVTIGAFPVTSLPPPQSYRV
ncbi:hypothetical protein QFC19_008695 [Naganishia cerealis]|uniref:Uncharacterized protein n=1 Tax=Naganishia cerealis TaxID=610337 RepID=A0ACC2V023_9TREE|nr:hypothetical protein QFC19_008695 [Naganishia cerealis]